MAEVEKYINVKFTFTYIFASTDRYAQLGEANDAAAAACLI